ncbi:putative amino acid transporter [Trypanosoma cruzi]|nr:putative amino acid transporter [Trypanosoma cruzi]
MNFWLITTEGIRELLTFRRFIIIFIFAATRDPCKLVEGSGSALFHTATGRSDIGARMLELARQHCDVRVQLAFVDEHRPLDAVVAAAATMTGLRLVSAKIAMHLEDSTVAGTWRTSVQLNYQISMFKCCCPLSGGGLGVGGPARADHCGKADIRLGLHPRHRGRCGSECSALLSGGRGA